MHEVHTEKMNDTCVLIEGEWLLLASVQSGEFCLWRSHINLLSRLFILLMGAVGVTMHRWPGVDVDGLMRISRLVGRSLW